MDDTPALLVEATAAAEPAGVATTITPQQGQDSEPSAERREDPGEGGTRVTLLPSSPAERIASSAEENTSSTTVAVSVAGAISEEGRRVKRPVTPSSLSDQFHTNPYSTDTLQHAVDTRVPVKAAAPTPAPQGPRRPAALMADAPTTDSFAQMEACELGTAESSVSAMTGRPLTDEGKDCGGFASGFTAEGRRLDATGIKPAVAPTRSREGATVGRALATGPEEATNSRERGYNRHEVEMEVQEIHSIYAAIKSGIPGAVSEVLGCIRDGQAVEELMAKNGRILLDRSTTFRGSGTFPAGGGNRGGGEGGRAGGGELEGERDEPETLAMLAALSGNVDMFTVVLQAMEQKLPIAHQITSVLETTDAEGRSLVASAAEGGSFAVVTKAVDVLGGEAAAFARMSSRQAGYFVKMAAKSGCIETLYGVIDMTARNGKINQAMKEASESDGIRANALVEAASSGSGEMVDAVVVAMFDELTDETVASCIAASGQGRRRTTALIASVEARKLGAVTAVIRAVSATVDEETSNGGSNDDDELRGVRAEFQRGGIVHAPAAARAAVSPALENRRHLSRRNRNQLPDIMERRSKNIAGAIMAKNARGMTALSCAATNGDLDIMFSVLDAMSKFLSRGQISEACSFSFSKCCASLTTSVDDVHLEVLAHLLQHGAKPASKAFTRLCNHTPPPLLKERLLGAVSSADNPFVPGMNISVACTVASIGALEGEKRRLGTMQAAVDELLLEILDHMPQTVMGFKNEMKDCSAIFEPETVIPSYRGFQGPLSVALTNRRQVETYCTTPLVLDYMSRKFTKGLPGLMDREGVLLNNKNFTQMGQTLYGEGLIAEGKVFFFGMALQRDYGESTLASITFFPGARFIIAGLLSRPGSYYKVPALRMALDLVTYLSMLAIFGGVVLQERESGIDGGEIIFAAYVFGAILTECREIYADPMEYMRDQWNVLDVASLIPLLIGMCFRAARGVEDNAAKACYALGAPLVFARILYFAQVLPSQGPMIQVFFSMAGLLVQFGTIMFVVMSGFVVSFYSLFRDTISYGEVWRDVFKAMLGETDYFDDISGTEFEIVGTLLLVVFILVLTIMMLNLLVAVLSTAHAKVDNDTDLEYKVTKARLIQRYTQVVRIDRLPPPYNLAQGCITLPLMVAEWFHSRRARSRSAPTPRSTATSSSLTRSSSAPSASVSALLPNSTSSTNHKPRGAAKAANGCFGRTVFWLVIGPLAVLAGWALWAASTIKAPFVVWEASRNKSFCGKISRATLAIVVCTVAAPLWLLVMWVRGGLRGVWKVTTIGFPQCCSSRTKENRRTQGRRRVQTGGRTAQAGRKTPDSPFAADTAVAQNAEDASEKVVVTTLKTSEGALTVSELQLFLDDPMSDPDVRRDEETRPTTVEHIKLLRNRLEATNKAHMDEMRACLERTAGGISRQLAEAGLHRGQGDMRDDPGGCGFGTVACRARAECDHGCDERGKNVCHERDESGTSPNMQTEDPRRVACDGSSQLDDRLEKLTSALERRMVAMIEERLDAMAKRVDTILAPLQATPG
ncbi:unnamed protein product [Scytosiphon promiscuus]